MFGGVFLGLDYLTFGTASYAKAGAKAYARMTKGLSKLAKRILQGGRLTKGFKIGKKTFKSHSTCIMGDNFIDGAVWIPEDLLPEITEQIMDDKELSDRIASWV